MSKSSPRLGRPGGGSKNANLRKELQGNRSCMLRVGERLMRAGSEGNLVQSTRASQSQGPGAAPVDGQTQPLPLEERRPSDALGNPSTKEPGISLSRVSLPSSTAADGSSTERLLQKKQQAAYTFRSNSDLGLSNTPPRSPSTLPRRYGSTTAPGNGAGSARDGDSELDDLMMQHSEMERKKEVFLDHLKHKYPHHAAIIMGHQERVRQVRSPRPSASPPLGAGVLGSAERQDPLSVASLESLETTMSEGEVLPATGSFTRGSRARASLPVARSASQTRDRPKGVLYLQYAEDTKQVALPSELAGLDTLRALFVSAFPHQLSMKMLESPSVAIYIRDTGHNVYYELEDVRNIASRSCLKVYHKDASHVFNRRARPSSTDPRISKEVLYGNPGAVHSLPHSARSNFHNLQGSMSPPMVRSMPSSPSRMVYAGAARPGGGAVRPASATLPREQMSGAGRSVNVCNSSSAILERRDVKPDEDMAGSKSMALVVRGDGGPRYPDSYCSLQDGGRLSMASSLGSAPASLMSDVVDAGGGGGGGGHTGLPQYRATIKPLVTYGDSLEHRQSMRKYGDSQLPPSSSPHRVSEVRGVGMVNPERMSPVRRSLRRESNGAVVEVVSRSRGSASSSSSSSVFVDSPHGPPDGRLFQGHVTAGDPQAERIKAMEQQIASLTGLVQHALALGTNIPGIKDIVSESDGKSLLNNGPGTRSAQNPGPLIDGYSPALLAIAGPAPDGLHQRLTVAKTNVSDLRLQLGQLRNLQVEYQESMSSMFQMAGRELSALMCERLAHCEQTAHRHRVQMDQERLHYLNMQERVLSQLSELEVYVEHLKRESASSPAQPSVTLRDVEEGAVNLRRVGESLAALKSEFPQLQLKMRSVLRVEVEAVRFLKEEPHRMDSMLKRVKALTEALSGLRRYVTESHPHLPESITSARPVPGEPLEAWEPEQGRIRSLTPQNSPKPQPRSSVRPPLVSPVPSGTQAEGRLAGPASPIMPHHVRTAAAVIQSCNHHPSPPLTPTHGRDTPTVAKVSPRSRENSPALQKRKPSADCCTEPADSQTTMTSAEDTSVNKHTVTDTESERPSPEGNQGEVTPHHTIHNGANISEPEPTPTTTTSTTSTDFEQILQEAQASLMSSIPDLEVSNTEDPSPPPLLPPSSSGTDTEAEPASDLTQQVPGEQPTETKEQPLESWTSSDPLEEDTPKVPDKVDTPQSKPSVQAPVEVSQPAVAPAEAPAVEPSSAPPGAERAGRPLVEKPRRPSVERERRQSPDKAGKSPPPPPPRRFYPASPGLTTGRSGEVIFTRKDPVGAQDEEAKEAVVTPQPKPLRQPPEVKPKPPNPHSLSATAPAPALAPALAPAPAPSPADPATESSDAEEDEEEEEEEEEDDMFMKELQVFQQCTLREIGSRCVVDLSASDPQSREIDPKIQLWKDNPLFCRDDNNSPPVSPRVMYYVTGQLSAHNPALEENAQCKEEERAPPPLQVANQNPPELKHHPELIISDHQVASEPEHNVLADQSGCSENQTMGSRLEQDTEAEKDASCPDKKIEEDKHLVQRLPVQNIALEQDTEAEKDASCPDQKMEEEKHLVQQLPVQDIALEQDAYIEKDASCPDQKIEEEKYLVQQLPEQNKAVSEKVVELPSAEKYPTLDTSPCQENEEGVENVPCPNPVATAKTMVPVVTLQKQNLLDNMPTPEQIKSEKQIVQQVPTVMKVELPPVVALQKETFADISPVSLDERIEEEVVNQIPSPNSVQRDKKVMLTTIITLQTRDNIPNVDEKHEEVEDKQLSSPNLALAGKKSNLTVVVTLQKENVPTDGLVSESTEPSQGCITVSPTHNVVPSSASFTDSPSSQQQNHEAPRQTSRDQSSYSDEGCSLSPDLFDDEGPPPPPPPTDKFSLRMSKNRVKVQSKVEHQDTAKANSPEVHNVMTNNKQGEQDCDQNDDFDSKPIIIVFNEPMDIQSACKRLSTIFETEEDLDKILPSASIEYEEEQNGEESETSEAKFEVTANRKQKTFDSSIFPSTEDMGKSDSPCKSETKKKFKFKFPKNKLAAIRQALQTGTSKPGKKTLEVVVYEEEEELAPENKLKESKETRRFEINSLKQQTESGKSYIVNNGMSSINTRHPKSPTRTEELCRSAYNSISSLEESIKALEISVDNIATVSSPSSAVSLPPLSPNPTTVSKEGPQPTDKVSRERERSPSKRPGSQILKGPQPPQSKKAKAQPPKETVATSAKRQTSVGGSPSSGQRSRSRHSPSSGSPEKSAKDQQSLQDPQRPFRQANSRGARAAAGDSNHAFLALPASKIPALCHTSPGKQSSAGLSAPHSPPNLSSPPAPSSAALSNSSSCVSSGSPQSPASRLSSPPPPAASEGSSLSPPPPPVSSPSPHKSLIPSLSLSRLLPPSSSSSSSSSPGSSPSHASGGGGDSRAPPSPSRPHGPRGGDGGQQRHLTLPTGATSSNARNAQCNFYSSSSSSYSSSSSSSSWTSSSLSPNSPSSSSSSPPSPSSSSLLHASVSPVGGGGGKGGRASASAGSPGHGKKLSGSHGSRVPRATTTAVTAKDTQ